MDVSRLDASWKDGNGKGKKRAASATLEDVDPGRLSFKKLRHSTADT